MRVCRRLLLALPLCAALACAEATHEDERACTLAGCDDGVLISLRARDGEWPAGRYRFEVVFDRTGHTCDVSLPDDVSSAPHESLLLTCEPKLNAWLIQRGELSLEVSKLGATSKTLQIVVERDGQTVFDHRQKLEYELDQPNGPGCDPTCRLSDIKLAF